MLDQIMDFFSNNTTMIMFAAFALVTIVGIFMFKTKPSNSYMNSANGCNLDTGMCYPNMPPGMPPGMSSPEYMSSPGMSPSMSPGMSPGMSSAEYMSSPGMSQSMSEQGMSEQGMQQDMCQDMPQDMSQDMSQDMYQEQ